MGTPDDYVLHPDLVAELKKMVHDLPPLTDEQLDDLADTIASIRAKAGR